MGEWIDSPTGEAARDRDYASAQVIEIPKYYQAIGNPWSLISTQFEVTSEYAANSYTTTQVFIEDVKHLIAELEDFDVPDITVASPEVPGLDYQGGPSVGDLNLDSNWPANTSAKPTLEPLPTIVTPNIPLYNIPDPDVNMPSRPEVDEVQGPGDAPVTKEVKLPTVPTYILPDVPDLPEITIPSVPQISTPIFDADLQEEVFDTPDGMSWRESPYNSDIWQGLLGKLIDGIERGGVALTPEIEAQIWERALSRQRVSDQKSYEEIESYFAAKGWDMPQGALASALQEKSDEIQRNLRETNIDIAVKQAEMADANTRFILQLSKDSEVFLRDFHNNQMNRKLDAEKAVAANAIDILNARVTQYNAKIEKYKADAAVYGERVKAALTQVEVFKAQVEGVKVSAEVQKNLVDIYEAQIGAVETVAKLYQAEMSGAEIAAKIEALKIDTFKTRVDAYVAEIGAEKAKYEMYGVAANAEKIKVEVFSERIKAFVSQIDLVKSQIEVQVVELEGKARRNDHEIDRYKAELQAYTVELDAESKKIGAIVEAYKGEVSAYAARTGAESARYSVLTEEIKARIEEARFNLELAKAEISSKTDGYVALKKLQTDGLLGVTNVSAQLSASAMNAVNASTSFGYSSGESMSTSFNYGASSQESHSFSHPTRQLS